MCSNYTIKTSRNELTKAFPNLGNLFPEGVDGRFIVHQVAPVIVSEGLKPMNFSLIPHWSKERKVKFATHNARLFAEDGTPIFEKPTWKTPFKTNHCIVPISKFIEPIYTGEYAGNMVRFFGDEVMYAAGISDSWIDKATGEEIESFSILTDDPVDFVKSVGHDRTPVFITGEAANRWLNLKISPSEMIQFLRNNRYEPKNWQVEIDRAMKSGWEKRIPK